MTLYKNKYRVESNRNQYWDYSRPGRYFITVLIENRELIPGKIIDKKIELSEFGKIVRAEILKIPNYYSRIILDKWIIMPDHIHLLIELGKYDFHNGIAPVIPDDKIPIIPEDKIQ